MKFITLFIEERLDGRKSISAFALQVLTIVVLLAVWEYLGRSGVIPVYKYSYPTQVIGSIWDLAVLGFPAGVTALVHIKATFMRIVIGFSLACLVGIPLGLFLGRTPKLQVMFEPIITFFRSMAVISLLPLAIAWFGVGETARVFLIFYACFWIILTSTIEGAANVDRLFINVGLTMNLSRFQMFRRIILPASTPTIFSGMKVAVGMAFMVIVAVEMIGTIEGLGALIQQARSFYRTSVAISGMVLIGLIGLLISVCLDQLEWRLMPWQKKVEMKDE